MIQVTEAPAVTRGRAVAAAALALAGLAAWILAGTVDDALYLVSAASGIAAVVAGWTARDGATRRLALAAVVVGGLLAAQIIVYSAVWAVSELV